MRSSYTCDGVDVKPVSNAVIGLTVAGLATLREAIGSATASAQFQRAWNGFVDDVVTEVGFAFLDGVETGQAGIGSPAVSAQAAEVHGRRIRALAATAAADVTADDRASRRAAAAYLVALGQFSEAHGLRLESLPTFDVRLREFEQFDPLPDPNLIRSDLDAALETLTIAPVERTTA
jgi:hypothetical protein